jgi:hypothetical protein
MYCFGLFHNPRDSERMTAEAAKECFSGRSGLLSMPDGTLTGTPLPHKTEPSPGETSEWDTLPATGQLFGTWKYDNNDMVIGAPNAVRFV